MKKILKNNGKKFIVLKFLLTIIIVLINISSIASQTLTGTIAGIIVDSANGEALIGANVVIDGTMKGAAADIDGKFRIEKVPVGKYNLVFSMVGYAKKKVKDVIVKKNETTIINITLIPEAFQTEEVVITAKALNNTEASLLVKRQKAIVVSDAVSSEQFAKFGAGNAAEAAKAVVGASIVEGKYVFIRGLGDRYTRTQLNGAEVPSIDPYKKSASIDLIPSNLIDNIQAIKTFTPDKAGDFSGGYVDINTKDFPEKLNISFSVSGSYNSEVTFSRNGLTAAQSSTDWLGMDNGMRELPEVLSDETFNPQVGKAQTDEKLARQINEVTKAFSNEMNPSHRYVPLNQSYSLSIGNQIDFLNSKLGYLIGLSYKRNHSGYFNGILARWSRGVLDPAKSQLDTNFYMHDKQNTDNVLWGSTFKLSYKVTPKHIISIDGMINQNGKSSARFISGTYPYDQDPKWLYQVRKLHYQERRLSSFQLNGKHQFLDLLNLKMNWKAAFLDSYQNEPDLRFFYNFVTQDSIYGIKSNLAPERYFRKTDENKKEFQLNFSLPFKQWAQETAKFKFGFFYSDKNREFRERRFVYSPANRIGVYLRQVNGDLSELFSDKYLGWVGTDTLGNGTLLNKIPIYIQETNQISSNYDATNIIKAAYAMIDLPITLNFRFIGGIRFETTDMEVNSIKIGQNNGRIETNDLLPSINFVYSPVKDMNIRMSYSKTLARPNFREIAPFSNYDFNGGDRFVGNPELGRTLINNFDLRWEWFGRPGEVFAISLYRKEFYKPIEVKILDAVNNVLSWTNVDNALVNGLELEGRVRLDYIDRLFKRFYIGANFSLIDSKVDIDESELRIIKLYDPDAKDTRPFQGQSPYLLNINLNYENLEAGFNASVFYNVFGKRLAAVGSVGAPDVYEQPFHLLNFSLSKKILSYFTIIFKINNIINSKIKKIQYFKDKEYIYNSYSTGTTVSLSINYSL